MSNVLQVRISAKTSLKQVVIVEKNCQFLCGASTTSADPVDKTRPSIRWGRDSEDVGTATWATNNCYYCERAWILVATSHDRIKKTLQDDLKNDVAKLRNWRLKRDKIIEQMKLKALGTGVAKRQDGVKNV